MAGACHHNLYTGDYLVDVNILWADIPVRIARKIMVAMTHGTLQIANSDLEDSPIVLFPNANEYLFGSPKQAEFTEWQTASAQNANG